jgi:hypothetical protein
VDGYRHSPMIHNSIYVRDNTKVLRFLYSCNKFCFRTPVGASSAFLVEFTEVEEIVDVISDRVLT